jgi:hypothetical protein
MSQKYMFRQFGNSAPTVSFGKQRAGSVNPYRIFLVASVSQVPESGTVMLLLGNRIYQQLLNTAQAFVVGWHD